MGGWAESEFGVGTLPPRAYLFAGASSRDKVDAVLGSFGKVLFHRHDVYERYLVGGDRPEAVVLFQLYGAPIMCDLVSVLKDGDVKEAIFFGTAYGFAEEMHVGDRVVPTQVQTLDGVSARLGAGRYTAPHPDMVGVISAALEQRQLPFRTGKSVSVPATLWHGDESEVDREVLALELEFAAFCHCTAEVGIRAGGLLVISDTRKQGMLDETRIPRDPILVEAFGAVRDYLER